MTLGTTVANITVTPNVIPTAAQCAATLRMLITVTHGANTQSGIFSLDNVDMGVTGAITSLSGHGVLSASVKQIAPAALSARAIRHHQSDLPGFCCAARSRCLIGDGCTKTHCRSLWSWCFVGD